MKTKKHSLLQAVAIAMVAMIAVACGNEPAKPENENNNKLHEDPTTAVFTLVEGTLKGEARFEANPSEDDFVADATSKQVIYWEVVKGENFRITNRGLSKFQVKSTHDNPNVVYALTIDYYNAKGEPMNKQFFENEQDKIHQHFFEYFRHNGTALVRVKKHDELPFDYTYADVLNGKFIGNSNPMGFKGFVKFNGNVKKFDLTVSLMHSGNKTKFDRDGKPSPFWMPSKEQVGKALWDFKVVLPIEVIK